MCSQLPPLAVNATAPHTLGDCQAFYSLPASAYLIGFCYIWVQTLLFEMSCHSVRTSNAARRTQPHTLPEPGGLAGHCNPLCAFR